MEEPYMDPIYPGLPGRERKLEAGVKGPSQLWGAGETREDSLSGWIDADRAITMVWVGQVIKEVRTHLVN